MYSQSSGHLDSLHNSQGSGDKQEITESSQRLKTNIINSVGGDSVFSLPFYSIKKWLILRWLCPKLYISGVTPQSSLILEECQQFMSKQDELQISETPPEGIKDNHRYQMTVKVFYMNSLNVWGPSIENPNYMEMRWGDMHPTVLEKGVYRVYQKSGWSVQGILQTIITWLHCYWDEVKNVFWLFVLDNNNRDIQNYRNWWWWCWTCSYRATSSKWYPKHSNL